jgi:hypothetical protein
MGSKDAVGAHRLGCNVRLLHSAAWRVAQAKKRAADTAQPITPATDVNHSPPHPSTGRQTARGASVDSAKTTGGGRWNCAAKQSSCGPKFFLCAGRRRQDYQRKPATLVVAKASTVPGYNGGATPCVTIAVTGPGEMAKERSYPKEIYTKRRLAAATTCTTAQSSLREPPPLLIDPPPLPHRRCCCITGRRCPSLPDPLSPWWSLGDGEDDARSSQPSAICTQLAVNFDMIFANPTKFHWVPYLQRTSISPTIPGPVNVALQPTPSSSLAPHPLHPTGPV